MTRQEWDAAAAAILAKYSALADDNPDSMRYHQRDQGGSTTADYAAMREIIKLGPRPPA